MDEEEINWARLAMLIDSEGCFHIRKDKMRKEYHNYSVQIAIVNTDRRVLEFAQQTTGMGSIIEIKPKNKAHKLVYRYVINGYKCKSIIQRLHKWLIIKQNQADLCLMFPEAHQGVPNSTDIQEKREELYSQMKVLNKRGTQNDSTA